MVEVTKRRKCSRKSSLACSFFSLTFLWLATTFGSYYYAVNHTQTNPQPNNAIPKESENISRKIAEQPKMSSANPWHGWQPKIADNMECGWETCLRDNHGCRTCRDEDLGVPPPVPEDWVPDVTVLHGMYLQGHDGRGNPWPPPLPPELCDQFGVSDTNRQLFDAVPVTVSQQQGPTIFCGIYTMAQAHSKTIRAMRETWAPRCDGFLAFSTQSDPRIPAMAIQHQGKEEYGNMWQKSRAIWKYIGTHYLEDFDYFFIGGEDLFVIVDNLRAYLATLSSPNDDHFVGRRFKGYGTIQYFNSGGAGYALSRGTLRKFVTQGYDHPDCMPDHKTSMEDVMMAKCLREVFHIGLTDTRDAQGRERFHPFAPGAHLTWSPPAPGQTDWYEDYNKEWGLKLGKDCCAPDSVSFHYIKRAAMVRHLHSLLYYCNKP